METKLSSRNTFETLCLWASRNGWCWNVYCTTCANREFYIGFSLIAKNISFEVWNHNDRRWPWRMLLPNPPLGWSQLTDSELKRFGRVLGSANLQAIRDDYKAQRTKKYISGAEDWLGYLGVVLGRYPLMLEDYDKVAIAWRRQLDCMLGLPASNSNISKPVTFDELEGYEKRLIRASRAVSGLSHAKFACFFGG